MIRSIVNLLTCPKCFCQLEYDYSSLKCFQGHQFPVLDGIPLLLTDLEGEVRKQLSSYEKDLDVYENWDISEKDYRNLAEIWSARLVEIRRNFGPLIRMHFGISNNRLRYGSCGDDDNYVWIAYGPRIDPSTFKKMTEKFGMDLSRIRFLYSELRKLISLALRALRSERLRDNVNILEIGSGIGRTLLDCSEIAESNFKHSNIIGLEKLINKVVLSKKILTTRFNIPFLIKTEILHQQKVFSGYGRDNIQLVIGDADDSIPLKRGSWDLVIVSYLLGLLEKPEAFLNKITALPRSGGFILIADDYGWHEEIRPRHRRTTPNMVNESLEIGGLHKFIEDKERPILEPYGGRLAHVHLTRFTLARKP